MRILIRYSDTTVQAAMLLATIGPRVRAAAPGCDDALEFTRTSERWWAEDGRTAEIEFDVAADAAEWIAACNAAAPADSTADFAMPYWPVPEPAETGSAYLN
ncbi:MAG: hypothetical protein ABSF25_14470 [Bryobacteraceae bacterium]|jgi:hypothetical protein